MSKHDQVLKDISQLALKTKLIYEINKLYFVLKARTPGIMNFLTIKIQGVNNIIH